MQSMTERFQGNRAGLDNSRAVEMLTIHALTPVEHLRAKLGFRNLILDYAALSRLYPSILERVLAVPLINAYVVTTTWSTLT